MIEALGDPLAITVAGTHSWMIADPDAFGEVITNVLPVAMGALAAEHEPGIHDLATLRDTPTNAA